MFTNVIPKPLASALRTGLKTGEDQATLMDWYTTLKHEDYNNMFSECAGGKEKGQFYLIEENA